VAKPPAEPVSFEPKMNRTINQPAINLKPSVNRS
jgi:hypothetical protein